MTAVRFSLSSSLHVFQNVLFLSQYLFRLHRELSKKTDRKRNSLAKAHKVKKKIHKSGQKAYERRHYNYPGCFCFYKFLLLCNCINGFRNLVYVHVWFIFRDGGLQKQLINDRKYQQKVEKPAYAFLIVWSDCTENWGENGTFTKARKIKNAQTRAESYHTRKHTIIILVVF